MLWELEHLQQVAVRVLKGGDPASPVLLLRRADEFRPCCHEPLMFRVNVLDAQVGHDSEGIF